jgi:hypothetical protein
MKLERFYSIRAVQRLDEVLYLQDTAIVSFSEKEKNKERKK